MKSYYIVFVLALLFSSCQEDKIFFVADRLGDCETPCLLVRENAAEDWTNFDGQIEGFDYEEGYEYQLKVKIEKNKADSSLKYTLLDLISKTKKEQKSILDLSGNEWTITQIVGYENKTDKFPNFLIKDGIISGNSGCNSFGGAFDSDGKSSFNPGLLRMTKMYCEAYMSLEKAFTEALAKAANYKINGDLLEVYDNGENLVFSATQKTKTTRIENKWFVNTIKGFINTTDKIPYFTIDSGQIKGNNGCNSFGGEFQTDESGLFKPGMLSVTERYCEKYASLENAFHGALRKATSYQITDGVLFLLDESKYVVLSAGPENKTADDTSYVPYVIEYNTYSRGLAIRNKVQEEKNVLYYHDLRPEKTEEQKVILSKSELLFFKKALAAIDLKEIENLEPPSTDHQHDGAPGATLIISFKGKSYRVPTFDHGNPPQTIKSIVDKIMELRSK